MTDQPQPTPRRISDEDLRRQREEVPIRCTACNDFFIYNRNDIQERIEKTNYGFDNKIRFVKCVCGADRTLGIDTIYSEDKTQ